MAIASHVIDRKSKQFKCLNQELLLSKDVLDQVDIVWLVFEVVTWVLNFETL